MSTVCIAEEIIVVIGAVKSLLTAPEAEATFGMVLVAIPDLEKAISQISTDNILTLS
jgi:hypothetical protein